MVAGITARRRPGNLMKRESPRQKTKVRRRHRQAAAVREHGEKNDGTTDLVYRADGASHLGRHEDADAPACEAAAPAR